MAVVGVIIVILWTSLNRKLYSESVTGPNGIGVKMDLKAAEVVFGATGQISIDNVPVSSETNPAEHKEEFHNPSKNEANPEESSTSASASVSPSASKNLDNDEKPAPITSNNSLKDLPSDFRICRFPTPEYGQPKLSIEQSPIETKLKIDVRYQCAGRPYEEYMRNVQFPYVLTRHKRDPSLRWGKRPSILPPASSSNQKIMMIGNSHTRQLAISLLCMYIDDVEDVKTIESHARQFTLTGNNTITLVANPELVYSSRWQKNLEEFYLNHPLDDLDAIVLGMFNKYEAKYSDSRLWTRTNKFAQEHPEQEIAFDDPSLDNRLESWFESYDGPILYTADPLRMEQCQREVVMTSTCKSDADTDCYDNLRWIDEREHVPALKDRHCTCSNAADKETVRTCLHDKDGNEYKTGHVCRGFLGGYSDLTARDVIEALWDVLG